MGFFSSIGNFFSGAVKTVAKVATNPVKAATTIATGGLNLAVPSIGAPIEKAIGSTLFNPNLAASLLTKNPAPLLGGKPMGLDLSTLLGGSNASQALRTVTSAVTPSMGGIVNVLGTGLDIFSSLTRAQTPMATSVVPQQASLIPQAMRGMGATFGVVKRFKEKFPNLAVGLAALKARGANVSRSKLWGLMRKFGPEILITGGLLTAAAVNELMMAGPGRRRMNPANVKALRRSMRRLESFHRLCTTADRLRRPRGRSCKSSRGSAQQFVRQG